MSITVDKIQLEVVVEYNKKKQEINQVTKDLQEQTSVLNKLDAERKKLNKKYKDPNRKEVQEANAAYEKQKKVVEELTQRKTKLERQLPIEAKSIRELREEIKKYNGVLNNLTPGTEKFNETKQHLDGLKARLAQLTGQAGGAQSSLSKWTGALKDFGLKFLSIGAIITTVVSTVKKGAAAWYEYNKEMAEAYRLTREFLGLNGKELTGMVAEIKATADVWGKDYKETLEAVDALMAQYGITSADALKIVQDGFQSGADLNNDMISKIKQYAPAFRDAGIGANQLVAIIQQTRSGIFSDNGLALISMAAKRIREMSDTARTSLQGIGIDVDNMVNDLNNGTITMWEAIQQIAGGMKTVGENSQAAGDVLRDVFGRQGAVAGQEMIKSLQDMNTDLESLVSTTGEYGQLQQREVEVQTELNKRTQAFFADSEGGFDRMMSALRVIGTQLLIKIMDGLIQSANYIIELYNNSMMVRSAWVVLKNIFTTVFMILKDGLSVIGNAIDGLIGVVSGAVVAMEGLFTLDFSKAWEGIKAVGGAIGDFIADVGKDFQAAGKDWGDGLVNDINNINNRLQPIKIPVTTGGRSVSGNVGGGRAGGGGSGGSGGGSGSGKGGAGGGGGSTDEFSQALAAQEQQYRELQNSLKRMLNEQLLTEEEYHDESAQAEMEFLLAKIRLQEQYGKDSSQTQSQWLDKVGAEANRQRQLQQKQMNDALATAQASYNADQLALQQRYFNGEINTEAEYNAKKAELELDYQTQRRQIIEQYGGDATDAEITQYQAALAAAKTAAEQKAIELKQQMSGMSTNDALKLINDNAGVLGYQKAEQMKTEILQAETQRREQIQQSATEAFNNLTQSASSLFSALQQRETAAVDAKYKRLIAAAKKQGKDTTKLEEQQEAEKAAIQKKYAQRSFQLQILQIIANTAQSIMKTGAELGYPAAIPFVAIAAATGAMQLATAKAQMDAAAGLYKGGYNDGVEGYTADGNPRDAAGMIPVHKREFVANHRAVANPHLRPVFDVIDRHQRMGTIDMLNATRLLEEAYGGGRYQGGFSSSSGEGLLMSDGGTGEGMSLLRSIAENTAKTLTVRELRERIGREEQMERNARR